jgi:hypothetical protein
MDDVQVLLRDASRGFMDELEARSGRLMGEAARAGMEEAQRLVPVSEKPRTRYRGVALSGDDAQHLRDTLKYKLKREKGLAITALMGAGKFTADIIEGGTRKYANKAESRAARRERARLRRYGKSARSVEFGDQRTAARPFIGPGARFMERIFSMRIVSEIQRIRGLG